MVDNNRLEIEIELVKIRKDVDGVEKYISHLEPTLEKLSDISNSVATLLIKQDMHADTIKKSEIMFNTRLSTLEKRTEHLEGSKKTVYGGAVVIIFILSTIIAILT